ncbi:hypothetical protein [Actinocatenispora sera]|uniref:NACHT N-terminal helical domain 7-containing protein n=1 Tax=Actinocatenispora sera TaxID=390989 RepID=UPI003CC7D0D3
MASPVLGLFDVRAEVLKLAGPLLGRLSEHLTGATRYDRIQRLLAAHTVPRCRRCPLGRPAGRPAPRPAQPHRPKP